MKNTNLYNVIVSLNKEEKAAFVKWLRMENHKIWADSFTKISQQISKFGPSLKREALYKALFPNQPFDGPKYRRRLHDILNEFKVFASHQAMQKNKLDLEKYWLKWLSDKELFDMRERYFNGYLKKKLQGDSILWSGNLKHYGILSENYLSICASNHLLDQELATLNTNLMEEHFIAEILNWQLVLQSSKHSRGIKSNFRLGTVIQELVNETNDDRSEITELLFLALKLYESNDDMAIFESYTKKLAQVGPSLNPQLGYTLYARKSNFLAKHNDRTSSMDSLKKFFENEKERINLGFNLYFGKLSYANYVNVANLSIELGDLKWARQYSEDFKKYVNIEFQENSYNLIQASILKSEQKFEEALFLLNKIEFVHPIYHITVKFMQTQLYYQLKEDRVLESLIMTTIRFLNRKKEPKYLWKSVVNYLKFLKKLIRLRSNFNVDRKEKLLELINGTKNLINKKWLVEEIDKLK